MIHLGIIWAQGQDLDRKQTRLFSSPALAYLNRKQESGLHSSPALAYSGPGLVWTGLHSPPAVTTYSGPGLVRIGLISAPGLAFSDWSASVCAVRSEKKVCMRAPDSVDMSCSCCFVISSTPVPRSRPEWIRDFRMLQASSDLGHAASCSRPLVCQGQNLDLQWPLDFRMVEASSDLWACCFVLSSPGVPRLTV